MNLKTYLEFYNKFKKEWMNTNIELEFKALELLKNRYVFHIDYSELFRKEITVLHADMETKKVTFKTDGKQYSTDHSYVGLYNPKTANIARFGNLIFQLGCELHEIDSMPFSIIVDMYNNFDEECRILAQTYAFYRGKVISTYNMLTYKIIRHLLANGHRIVRHFGPGIELNSYALITDVAQTSDANRSITVKIEEDGQWIMSKASELVYWVGVKRVIKINRLIAQFANYNVCGFDELFEV